MQGKMVLGLIPDVRSMDLGIVRVRQPVFTL